MKPLAIVIVGASGRMGQSLIKSTLTDAGAFRLHAALDRPDSACIGQNAGYRLGLSSHVTISADLPAALQGADILIDFTRPEATVRHLAACREQGVNMIIGTTGLNHEDLAAIAAAADDIGIVHASNFSVGVNLTFKLIDMASRVLYSGFDVEIIEAHHRHKVDAPSGTALRMGEVAAQALGRDLTACATHGREGHTGPRPATTIGFSSIRGGDIVGDHTVLFAGDGERIEITHKASDRAIYAHGALRAAQWLSKKQGLFSMQDVLELN